jgi:hypothetical protein
MEEREARRYIAYSGAEHDDASERTRRRLPLRRAFAVTAVVVVNSVLLGLLFILALSAFSGRTETAFWREQTALAGSEDNLAPAGPLAPQAQSDAVSYHLPRHCCVNEFPRASPCCMGYWYYIVQGLCAVRG